MRGVVPYLYYEDADAAVEWLVRVFGCVEGSRQRRPDGTTSHCDLELNGAPVFLGAPGGGYRNPRSGATRTALVYAYVEDVDEHCERARAEGAAIVEEPADQPYGERRYAADDLEGQRWYFAAPIAATR